MLFGASMSYWWGLLCQPAYYPVYAALMLATVITWVVTTPLRNVGWTLGASLCELGLKHATLSAQIVEGYLAVAKDEGLRSKPPGDYVWLVYESFFKVPMSILDRDSEAYGLYGRLAFKGWDFAHEYWCVYLPDTTQTLWTSAGRYARGTLRSCVASYRRADGLAYGVFWVVMLICAVCVYVPLTLLRVLEVILCGWRGVLVLLSLLKVSDWIWSWGWWVNYLVAAGVLLITALATVHELRIGEELDKVSPAVVAQAGWSQVQADAARRRIEERSTLRELRGDKPVEEVGALDSPEEPQPEMSIPCERSPAAIQAELRQSQQRTEQLREEFEANSAVRRGRLNSSRGECPAPGNGGGVPAPAQAGPAFRA